MQRALPYANLIEFSFIFLLLPFSCLQNVMGLRDIFSFFVSFF